MKNEETPLDVAKRCDENMILGDKYIAEMQSLRRSLQKFNHEWFKSGVVLGQVVSAQERAIQKNWAKLKMAMLDMLVAANVALISRIETIDKETHDVQ